MREKNEIWRNYQSKYFGDEAEFQIRTISIVYFELQLPSKVGIARAERAVVCACSFDCVE
jgi:hypothetical protein